MKSVFIVVFLGFLCLVSCDAEQISIESRIHEWGEEQSVDVDIRAKKTLATGDTHHVAFLGREPGKRSLKLAMLSDGTVVSAAFAKKNFAETHEARWGRLELDLARLLVKNKTVNVAIVMTNLASMERMQRQIRKLGRESDSAKIPFPVVFTRMGVDDVALAKSEGVVRIMIVADQIASYQDPDTQGAAHYARSKSGFNDQGYFARDVPVGILEATSNGCRFRDGHEAFQHLGGVSYMDGIPCSDDSDCGACESSADSFCRDNFCVSRHATWVTSRVSHSSGSKNHAAEAQIFFANEGDLSPPPGAGPSQSNVDALINRLEWLKDNDVKIVNQSWGLKPFFEANEQVTPTFQSILTDWYAYHHGMTFVKAAGNGLPFDETDCHSLNSICVGATNSGGTISDSVAQYLDDSWASYSAFQNPFQAWDSNSDPASDVERPDIMSQGTLPVVARINNALPGADPGIDAWETTFFDSIGLESNVEGTSFSAPVITGGLALLEGCRGEKVSPILAKAIVRNSGHVTQEIETDNFFIPAGGDYPFYATPGIDADYDSLAGAGIFHAPTLRRACSTTDCEEDICHDSTDGTINLSGGVDFPITLITATPLGEALTVDEAPSAPGLAVNPLVRQSVASGSASSPAYEVLHEFGSISSGSRIRASLSFYGCPVDDPEMINGNGIAADIDLALCDFEEGECEFFSESLEDSNEGFDLVLRNNYDNLQLVALWARETNGAQTRGCLGKISPRLAWSVLWWRS